MIGNNLLNNSETFLVLTKEFALSNHKKMRLLGKWCVDYGASLNEIREAEHLVLPSPFEEEDALSKAYHYLKHVDHYLFPQLCHLLNEFHGQNKSQRYWRIVIGYWWLEFIDSLYTRYMSLKTAAKIVPTAEVKVLEKQHYITPYDTQDFAGLNNHDFYNYQLFSQLIDYLNVFNATPVTDSECESLSFNRVGKLESNWREIIRKIVCFFSRWNKYYFISTYINYKSIFKIALKLKVFPSFIAMPRFLFSKNRDIDHKVRATLNKMNGRDEFEKMIASLIVMNIPKIYIEDFTQLKSSIKRYFPNRPVKCILTATAYANNEGFKLFTAQQIESYKTPYIISQHGGCYGSTAWHKCEDYEKEIADHYLTYGWSECSNNKVLPFMVNRFYEYDAKITGTVKGDIIWVLTSCIRYPRMFYAAAGGPGFTEYLNEQAKFLVSLPIAVRSKVKVRPHKQAFGWYDLHYIQQQSYPLQLSNMTLSLREEAKNARLIVCTYNGTSHLETFALNVPTLLYWNPKDSPLRPDAEPIHQKLYNLGILHYDPEKAAAHLANIDEDILGWWQQPAIQAVRKEFCRLFVNSSPHYTEDWRKIMLKLSASARIN